MPSRVLDDLKREREAALNPLNSAPWSRGDGLESRCESIGHHLSAESVVYGDGVIAGWCEHCHDRVEIPRIPGGEHVLKAKGIVALIVKGDRGPHHSGELMVCVRQLEQQIDEDERAIEDALRVLKIAKLKLLRRLAM